MKSTPRRTHATDLTDNELLLFDVLFSCCASFGTLSRNGFRQRWNWHSHGFDDNQLRAVLTRLEGSGRLRTCRSDGETCFMLTERGGQQWELERQPVWDRYATERYNETPTGKPMFTIRATTRQTCDDFWRIGCSHGMFQYSNGRVRKATIRNHRLIPWKAFQEVHVVVAILDVWYPADSHGLEAARTWWRCVRENYKFWPIEAAV